jgi:hypothetical protein
VLRAGMNYLEEIVIFFECKDKGFVILVIFLDIPKIQHPPQGRRESTLHSAD